MTLDASFTLLQQMCFQCMTVSKSIPRQEAKEAKKKKDPLL